VRAWVADPPNPIRRVERDDPVPGAREVRVRVSVCGVCRTDLHLADGDLVPHAPAVVPGHEAVGVVDALGPGAERFAVGERIGIPWLRWTCGACRFCRRGDENLCIEPRFTGWDADGGYAELAVVPEAYAYRLPDAFDDETAAPLLCAGIVGYRALRAAQLPDGGRLGVFGFGGSAHLAAQVAIAEGATVHVVTRSPQARALAIDLGAASAGDAPPEALDAAIVFAPAGDVVPAALAVLDRGGTCVIAGIYLTDIPALRYADHLFEERRLRSVTANTRRDGEDFLATAAAIGIRVETSRYRFDHAADALADLAGGRVRGAAVIRID
jgi:propanol-preferring alcohol dehydrogenase